VKRLFPVLLTFFFATTIWAQGTGTGFPMYGSFESGVFDTTNRYNLNTNFSIPIVSSKGRGLDLNFALSYNSRLWMISSGAWVSVTNDGGTGTWGWMKTYPAGMLTNTTSVAGSCKIDGVQLVTYYRYSNYVYYDMAGTGHSFPTISWYTNACTDVTSGTTAGSASDGSGYYYDSQSSLLYDKSGIQISPGSKIKDTNGNYVSATVVNSSETDWKDSAGHNALKIVTGTGTIQYQVLDPTGAYQTTTVNLTTYNIKTNFGCTGVTEFTGTASLPSSISLPNGLSYSFTYEGTPSHSGYYTGRVSQVTLPSGGYIQYQYSSPNDGINCTDGSILNLTRTQNDGTTSSNWTFSRAPNGSNWVTTVTAPLMPYDSAANQAAYTFNSTGQETSEQFYQGSSSSGTLLRTINTTWASNGSPATNVLILEDNHQAEVDTTIDSNGNLLTLKEYDFGSGAPGPVLRTTNFTYLSTTSYTNLNILNRISRVTIADSGGTIKYREDIAYDATSLNPCPTGATQHDDTSYGCTFTTRGNPSSVTTYTDAATPNGGVAKNRYFDIFGNLVKADADCCQTKQWNYSSTTQYAYPDTVVRGAASGPQLTDAFTYNPQTGQVVSRTDPNSQVISYAYDTVKRLTAITRPDNVQVTFAYNDSQHMMTLNQPIQTGSTHKQVFAADGLGRPLTKTVQDASGTTYSAIATKYDPIGRPYQTSNPYLTSAQYWTTVQFDGVGRPTKRIAQDNTQTTYTYSGPSVTTRNSTGKQRQSQVDGAGRVVNVFEPDVTNNNALTVQTSYVYTALNQHATITQGTQVRTRAYDGMGRLTSQTDPEFVSGSQSYQYDSFNHVTQRTDPRGVVTATSYDTLNRPTQVSYNVGSTGVPATPTVTYTYGTSSTQKNNGRLLTTTDGTGSRTFSYDNLGRLTQTQHVVSGNNYTIGYGYALGGQRTSITYPSGRVVQRAYDAIGRPTSLASGSTTYANGYAYDPAGHITGFLHGNGICASRSYSGDRLQLQTINEFMPSQANQCQSSPSQTITNLTYGYAQSGGNDGEITTITDGVDAGRNATYAYDALGRVSTATTQGSTNYPKWGLSWTYDRFGNRTTQSISAGCVAPMTCPTNSVAVSTATNRITTSGYGYDTNGNMTNDGMNSIVPDAQNRVQSTSGSLGSGTYTYGASGHRVVKSSGGNTTVYIYAGNQVIAEYLNGTLTREYVHAGGNLLATHDSGTLYFHHRDHQSIRVTTDASGNKMGEQGHYPFGESWYLSNTTTKWQHTTYERDPESGNDYAMHRHNVNRLGRFLSLDPVKGRAENPQRLNRYSYVMNDPINRRDPTGLDGTWTGYDDEGSSNTEGSLDNSFCGVCMMAGPGEVVMDGTIVSASLGNMALATGAGAWGPAPTAPNAASSSSSEGADGALDLGTFALTNLDPGSTGSSNSSNSSGVPGDTSGSCAYLNAAGNGVESIDNQSSAGECVMGTGGAFSHSFQWIMIDSNSNYVLMGTGDPQLGDLTLSLPGQSVQDATWRDTSPYAQWQTVYDHDPFNFSCDTTFNAVATVAGVGSFLTSRIPWLSAGLAGLGSAAGWAGQAVCH
jgi:RHS repeat-associated protein